MGSAKSTNGARCEKENLQVSSDEAIEVLKQEEAESSRFFMQTTVWSEHPQSSVDPWSPGSCGQEHDSPQTRKMAVSTSLETANTEL